VKPLARVQIPRVFGVFWHWKSALLSSVFRAVLFLFANWSAGIGSAAAAMLAEFLYRSVTAGFCGTLAQRFRLLEPAWRGAAAASVVLPVATHSMEWLVHRLRGTPNLRASMTASVAFTVVSSLFHLFAMRRGHFIVGEGSRPLLDDLRQSPRLVRDFLLAGPKLLAARGRVG